MPKSLVIKANELISAKYQLTLNEQKVILYSISQLDTSNPAVTKVKIKVSEFCDLIGTSHQRYNEIRDVVRSLRKREIIIQDKQGNELIMGWLASIEHTKGSGYVELEFSEKIMPYLFQLKEQFTRYELKNVLHLDSVYSIRVYELCKQHQKIGNRKIALAELKEYLGINKNSYKRFYDFDTRVLKTAINEINQKTDLRLEYEKIKTGRKITHIKFIIQQHIVIDSPEYNKQIYDKYCKELYNIYEIRDKSGLTDENLTAGQIATVYEHAVQATNDEVCPFTFIKMNYAYMQSKSNIKNRYSYLVDAIKKDYANAKIILKHM